LDWAGLTSEKSEEKEIAENSSDAGRLQTAEIHFSFVSKQVKQNSIKSGSWSPLCTEKVCYY